LNQMIHLDIYIWQNKQMKEQLWGAL
jgi:hypothetical protein